MRLRLSVRPGFVAVCCGLLLLDERLAWLLLLTAAVHELGHLLALQCLGVEAAALVLTAGGGVIDCAPLPPRALALTALAGPAANLLWAALLLRPAPAASLLSLGMAGFNLLPVPPLDGGVALRALAGPRVVMAAAVASAVGLLGLSLWLRPLLGLWPLAAAGWALGRAALERGLSGGGRLFDRMRLVKRDASG